MAGVINFALDIRIDFSANNISYLALWLFSFLFVNNFHVVFYDLSISLFKTRRLAKTKFQLSTRVIFKKYIRKKKQIKYMKWKTAHLQSQWNIKWKIWQLSSLRGKKRRLNANVHWSADEQFLVDIYVGTRTKQTVFALVCHIFFTLFWKFA